MCVLLLAMVLALSLVLVLTFVLVLVKVMAALVAMVWAMVLVFSVETTYTQSCVVGKFCVWGGRDVAHGRMFSPCSKGVATGRHPKPCLTTPTCMVTASAIVAVYHGAGGVGWGGVCVWGEGGGRAFYDKNDIVYMAIPRLRI